MEKEKYLATQTRLLKLARLMHDLELTPFLDAIRTTEAVAPLIDPTAFKHGAKNLAMIKRLAEAAVVFQAAYPAPESVIEAALDAQAYRPATPAPATFAQNIANEIDDEIDAAIRAGLAEDRLPPLPTRRAGGRAFPDERTTTQ